MEINCKIQNVRVNVTDLFVRSSSFIDDIIEFNDESIDFFNDITDLINETSL